MPQLPPAHQLLRSCLFTCAAASPLIPQAGRAEPAGDNSDAASIEAAPEASRQTDAATTPRAESNATVESNATADAATTDAAAEVTVVGTSLAHTAGSARILSQRELERKEYDDPHAVLQAVPGVYARGEDGIGLRPNISLRGVNPDRSKKIALMEDGIPFGPAPYSAPAAYYFPLMTRMTQIRVIKGPAAITYGPQTIAGAIDFMTRPIPSETSGRIDVAGGQFGYAKVHGFAGSSDETAGFMVEGVHLRSDGFKQLPSGDDTGFYRNEWMFKGVYHPDPRAEIANELRLKLTYSEELSNETYLGLSDADFRRDPLQRYAASQLDQMRNHRTSIVASHSISPLSNLDIETSIYRHDYFRSWRKVNGFRGNSLSDVLQAPTEDRNAVYYQILRGVENARGPSEALLIGPNQREYVSQGVQTLLSLEGQTGPLDHRAEYGFRVHHDAIRRDHSEDVFYTIDGRLVPEGSPTITTTLNHDSSVALSLHAIDAISFKRLTVTPGIRFEAIRSASLDEITEQETNRLVTAALPGLGAYYALTEQLGLLAGAYRGFSPPPPGSEQLTSPEVSINYEAGARYSRGSSGAEVIGFFNDYQNLTDICTLSSGCVDLNLDRQFDAGEAHIYGFEAYVRHEFEMREVKLPLSVAYTLTAAEFQNTFQSADPIYGDVSAGDELPYVPRHQLNVSAAAETDTLGVNATFHYTSAAREQAGSGPFDESLTTEELYVLDAGAFYQVVEPLRLYLNVRNVLDDQFIVARRPYGARPNAPRWVQAGAKFSF